MIDTGEVELKLRQLDGLLELVTSFEDGMVNTELDVRIINLQFNTIMSMDPGSYPDDIVFASEAESSIGSKVRAVKDKIGGAISSIWNKIVDLVSSAVESSKSFVKTLKDDIGSIRDVISKLKENLDAKGGDLEEGDRDRKVVYPNLDILLSYTKNEKDPREIYKTFPGHLSTVISNELVRSIEILMDYISALETYVKSDTTEKEYHSSYNQLSKIYMDLIGIFSDKVSTKDKIINGLNKQDVGKKCLTFTYKEFNYPIVFIRTTGSRAEGLGHMSKGKLTMMDYAKAIDKKIVLDAKKLDQTPLMDVPSMVSVLEKIEPLVEKLDKSSQDITKGLERVEGLVKTAKANSKNFKDTKFKAEFKALANCTSGAINMVNKGPKGLISHNVGMIKAILNGITFVGKYYKE